VGSLGLKASRAGTEGWKPCASLRGAWGSGTRGAGEVQHRVAGSGHHVAIEAVARVSCGRVSGCVHESPETARCVSTAHGAESCHSGGRQVAESPSHVQPGGPYSMRGGGAPTPSRRLRRFCTTAAMTAGVRSRPLVATPQPLSIGMLMARTRPTTMATAKLPHTSTCRGHGCSHGQPCAGRGISGSECRRHSQNWKTNNATAPITTSPRATARTTAVDQPSADSSSQRSGEPDARRGKCFDDQHSFVADFIGGHEVKVDSSGGRP
jgi:hypothetical protein